ncbi:putative DNA polymerase III alpha subunit [Fadolivirus algeromassiliense]|jgi:hypothetical protein|uniref:DNA polymerase III alpha subunit n=1 Tax=Fadolivirus FV1/VV64 TaxID=3070911 RepID=A0A7D3QVT5_9VIRU|nr:putative DNA polymerase III alpha subunit [Fadolivirus algeromassiliense]QKF93899.1 putative DNA polymerase III alpha subunit [Fadolivirus FV1/VV64]
MDEELVNFSDHDNYNLINTNNGTNNINFDIKFDNIEFEDNILEDYETYNKTEDDETTDESSDSLSPDDSLNQFKSQINYTKMLFNKLNTPNITATKHNDNDDINKKLIVLKLEKLKIKFPNFVSSVNYNKPFNELENDYNHYRHCIMKQLHDIDGIKTSKTIQIKEHDIPQHYNKLYDHIKEISELNEQLQNLTINGNNNDLVNFKKDMDKLSYNEKEILINELHDLTKNTSLHENTDEFYEKFKKIGEISKIHNIPTLNKMFSDVSNIIEKSNSILKYNNMIGSTGPDGYTKTSGVTGPVGPIGSVGSTGPSINYNVHIDPFAHIGFIGHTGNIGPCGSPTQNHISNKMIGPTGVTGPPNYISNQMMGPTGH